MKNPINPDYFGGEAKPVADSPALWESAQRELLGFANHLEKRGAGITADQIRLAVQRGNRLAELEKQNEEST